MCARFQGLCDYGFGKKEELADQEAWVPGTVEPGKTSESLAVLPPLFSKEDLPLDYAFKLGKPTVAKKEQDKRYDMLYGEIHCRSAPFLVNQRDPKR